jgi:recombination protein RecA
MATEKQQLLENYIKTMTKTYGQGAVIHGNEFRTNCQVISTGSLKIDIATGVGGIPKGRITEVFGGESSGKTTLSLQTAANCQRSGGNVFYIDTEHALDPGYAKALGIDLDTLIISQPGSAEESLNLLKTAITVGAFDLIVTDSIASLVPQAVIDGDIGDSHVGRLARLMSENLPQFASQANSTNTAVLFTNQIRNKIGGYGDPTTTPGGFAMKFYSSMRIQTSRSTLNKDGDEVLGNVVKVKVVKNKLAPPFRECEPEIIYGEGFSREAEIVDIGSEYGIMEKSGSWYSYGGERVGQGKDAARQFLLANPNAANEIELKIKQHLGMSSL